MNVSITTPTDEQLAAYVSNTATPDAAAAVEAWMNEDPKHLDELLDMAVAASLPGRQQTAAIRMPWYRRPVYWAAAAVVALVLVAGVLWYQPVGTSQKPLVAEADVPAVTDGDGRSLSGDTNMPMVVDEKSQSSQQKAAKVLEESSPALPIQRYEHTTASQTVATSAQPMLELDFPRRGREVCRTGKDVTFRWQSNAAMLKLVITNGEGIVLHERNLTDLNEYTLPISVTQGQEELHWTLIASFGEGQSMKREGTIIQMHE